MKKQTLSNLLFFATLILGWTGGGFAVAHLIGSSGFLPNAFVNHPFLKLGVIFILMAHLTIAAMSICFHRSHTHQAVKLHPVVDVPMQIFLWMISSMSKLDWVSVHVYHHTHSDTPLDAHSPKQFGLAHVFFMGAYDYSKAKSWPEVLKIRKRLPTKPWEAFIARHLLLGPGILTLSLILAFGPIFGSVLSVLNFAITPLFAVGGVNALAHYLGYQNYDSKDESRNIGFLFFLNWIICGELDHNNHHKYPKSPSFAHRWFEFDIGWVYIRTMKFFGLATVTGRVPHYASVIASKKMGREPQTAPTPALV